MKKAIYSLLLAGGLSFSGTAYASHCVDFSNVDLNQDGAISQEEATAIPQLASQWPRLDRNSDGQIDEGEFARYRTGWDQTADALQIAGAGAVVVGGLVAAYGLLTGPGEAVIGPIGGGIALGGGAVGSAGYLIGRAARC